jgi:UTP--glucose-1-phosphate uridylyltransferase
MPVKPSEVSRFGIIGGSVIEPHVVKVESLVEKPKVGVAPSLLAVFGRYLLSARVMELLADVTPGAGGEIQLTDALARLLQEEEMYALIVNPDDGYDTGTVESWLETNNRLFAKRKA